MPRQALHQVLSQSPSRRFLGKLLYGKPVGKWTRIDALAWFRMVSLVDNFCVLWPSTTLWKTIYPCLRALPLYYFIVIFCPLQADPTRDTIRSFHSPVEYASFEMGKVIRSVGLWNSCALIHGNSCTQISTFLPCGFSDMKGAEIGSGQQCWNTLYKLNRWNHTVLPSLLRYKKRVRLLVKLCVMVEMPVVVKLC